MRRTEMTSGASRWRRLGVRTVDSAGVIGAVVAALCCAGTPVVVGALAAVGLSSLRKDAILWPAMLGSLMVAMWGLWMGLRTHRNAGPLLLGSAAGVSLASGVILVHGFPAMQMIYSGAIALVAGTLWNAWARQRSSTRRSMDAEVSAPALPLAWTEKQ